MKRRRAGEETRAAHWLRHRLSPLAAGGGRRSDGSTNITAARNSDAAAPCVSLVAAVVDDATTHHHGALTAGLSTASCVRPNTLCGHKNQYIAGAC